MDLFFIENAEVYIGADKQQIMWRCSNEIDKLVKD